MPTLQAPSREETKTKGAHAVRRTGKSETAGRREISTKGSAGMANDNSGAGNTPGGAFIPQHRPPERVPRTAKRPTDRSANAPRLDTPDQFYANPDHARAQAIRGAGGQPQAGGGAGHGQRSANARPVDIIDAIIRAHLISIGQQPGFPAKNALDPSQVSLAQLQEGAVPGGGLHEPGAMAGAGGMGGGMGGPGRVAPQLAAAGQNPLAPFLAQVLNPRASPASGMGAVPTLPGAPQGFSLYNMLRLIQMFKMLYGDLPTPTQGAVGLPQGIPGPGY